MRAQVCLSWQAEIWQFQRLIKLNHFDLAKVQVSIAQIT